MKNDFAKKYLPYYLARFTAFLVQAFPIGLSLAVSRLFGLIVHRVHKGRRIGYVNLKAAFGPSMTPRERRRKIRNMYLNLAQNVVEVFYFRKMDLGYICRHVDSPHFERLGQAVRKGRQADWLVPARRPSEACRELSRSADT